LFNKRFLPRASYSSEVRQQKGDFALVVRKEIAIQDDVKSNLICINLCLHAACPAKLPETLILGPLRSWESGGVVLHFSLATCAASCASAIAHAVVFQI
jgi:hypothetical protein